MRKRGYLLPPGCKDLIDVLNGPAPKPSIAPKVRVNGQILAHHVRVIGEQDEQFGIMLLVDALRLAQSKGLDLIEIAPRGEPPVCRLIDYGKFRAKESKGRKKKS